MKKENKAVLVTKDPASANALIKAYEEGWTFDHISDVDGGRLYTLERAAPVTGESPPPKA